MKNDYKALLNIMIPKVPETHQVTTLGTIADLDMILITPKELDPNKPNILLVSGTHGDESAGPWGVVKFVVSGGLGRYPDLNISIIPVVNPDAFNRNTRYDRWHGISNQGFSKGVPSKEVKILKDHKELINLAKNGFLSLHESDNTDRRMSEDHSKLVLTGGYYMYMLSQEVNVALREAMTESARPMGLIPDGVYWSKFEGTYRVDHGCVFNFVDDSFDHYLYVNGVPMCVTSETPMDVDFGLRVQANAKIAEAFMGVAAEGAASDDWVGTFMSGEGTIKAAKKYTFDDTNAWGFCVSISLTNCNPQTVRDALAITMYAEKLVKTIGGIAYGSPTILKFGKGDKYGFTFVQLLTTSSITGHFAEDTNSVFVDIFYCTSYDPDAAIRLTQDYFGGETTKILVFTR